MLKYFITALAAVILLWANSARAFTISPTRYLVTMNPQETQILQLNIKNDEEADQKFKIFVSGLMQQENGVLSLNKNSDSAEVWVNSEKDNILIRAGRQEHVKFIISIPKDTPPGSHYLGLAVETVAEAGAGNAISGRLFAILTLRVAGEARETVSIEEWRGPIFTWSKNWPVILKLKNNGNIDVPLKGAVDINYNGQPKEKFDWLLGNNLLSGSSRYLEKSLSPKIIWPGRYEAQIKISYGRTGQLGLAVFNVWYFPPWSFFVISLILFLFWLSYFKIKRRHDAG